MKQGSKKMSLPDWRIHSAVPMLLSLITWLLFVRFAVRLLRMAQLGPPIPPVFPDPLQEHQKRRRGDPAGRLDIREGMQVLEIGPGPGQFTQQAAWRAGRSGRVFVVNTQEVTMERLEPRLGQTRLDTVSVHAASPYELPFTDASIDRAFLDRVLNRVADRQRALMEVRRVLKPEGRLGVDQRLLDLGFPRRKRVMRWGREAGFELMASYGNPLRYLLVFRPAPKT